MKTKLIKFELMQRIAEVLDEAKVIIANEADCRMVSQGGNDEHTATLYRAVNKITDLSKQLNNIDGADEYIAAAKAIGQARDTAELLNAKKYGGVEYLYFHMTGKRISVNTDAELEAAMQDLNKFNQDSISEGI